MGPQLFQSVVPEINVSTMDRREWRDIDFTVTDYIATLSSWWAAGGQHEKAKSKKSEQMGLELSMRWKCLKRFTLQFPLSRCSPCSCGKQGHLPLLSHGRQFILSSMKCPWPE